MIQVNKVQSVLLLNLVIHVPWLGQQVDPLLQVEVNCEKEYQVSMVEDGQVYQCQLNCIICWKCYDSFTWEAIQAMGSLLAVEELHNQYSLKPGPLENVH